MSNGQINYGCVDGTHIFELVGEVRAHSCVRFLEVLDAFTYLAHPDSDKPVPSLPLPAVMSHINTEDIKGLLVDLNQAVFLDSTALGVIARLGAIFCNDFGRQAVLLCTNVDMLSLVKSMGLAKFYVILRCDSTQACTERLADSEQAACLEEDLQRTVVEAHRSLIALSQHNKQTFESLVQQLESNYTPKPPHLTAH